MSGSAADLTIVIPTRDRWRILGRTLDALSQQTVTGFEIIVVVDGDDQRVPPLESARVLVREAGGSAAARNAGIAQVTTPITMLLDDDMVPVTNAVEQHLDQHKCHDSDEVAVLGRVLWHPELRATRISRWLDWSSMMFPFVELDGLAGEDVGWGRFCSCNVSLKTAFLRSVGGFDETFIHYYEDTDLAKRLGERGMRLIYEPRAVTHHLQNFEWSDVRRRFDQVAIGERLMARKHVDFDPWFKPRMEHAQHTGTNRVWPHLVDRVPPRPRRLRRAVEQRAHLAYLSALAPSYLANWDRAGVLAELMDYLGETYDPRQLIHNHRRLEAEADAADDEEAFYRSSETYLYNLTVFEMSGTKDPYRALLARHLPSGATVLDYGCGIGGDGLQFGRAGFRPSFADFANPSSRFLRWRLARRGLDAPVYDIERDEVPPCDAVFSFDVIEHVDDPYAYLERLESLGGIVAVNLLEPDPDDTHLHRPLPIADLVERARGHGLLEYEVFYGRSHLLVYETAHRGHALAATDDESVSRPTTSAGRSPRSEERPR